MNKRHIFQYMGKIFCVEFQREPERYNFHTKLKFQELLDLRAHKFFFNLHPGSPPGGGVTISPLIWTCWLRDIDWLRLSSQTGHVWSSQIFQINSIIWVPLKTWFHSNFVERAMQFSTWEKENVPPPSWPSHVQNFNIADFDLDYLVTQILKFVNFVPVSHHTKHFFHSASQLNFYLTHWGRVMHICVGKQTIIGLDNGLAPSRRQAIIWTNAGLLLIGPLGTNFSEILIWIQTFSFKKMHLKMSSAKWRPFCLSLNVLMMNWLYRKVNLYFHCATFHEIDVVHSSNFFIIITITITISSLLLTHWGRVTQISVVKLTIIGSDNGLSPGRRQAIIWTNAGILLIGPLGTNFSEILIEINTFSFTKMHLKMSSGKWRPFVSASMC